MWHDEKGTSVDSSRGHAFLICFLGALRSGVYLNRVVCVSCTRGVLVLVEICALERGGDIAVLTSSPSEE